MKQRMKVASNCRFVKNTTWIDLRSSPADHEFDMLRLGRGAGCAEAYELLFWRRERAALPPASQLGPGSPWSPTRAKCSSRLDCGFSVVRHRLVGLRTRRLVRLSNEVLSTNTSQKPQNFSTRGGSDARRRMSAWRARSV